MQSLFRLVKDLDILTKAIIVDMAIALLLVVLPVQRAQAQQSERPQETAEAIIVTASRSDTRLEEMPLYTTVVTQEDIRRSPAQSLDQLLRNVPSLGIGGTPVALTDPTGQNIRFRGMDKKVLMLLDGMPIHDPFYTTIQWYKIPPSSVDRIEIIRGGGSSLWGNLAVGGVINIVSKRPTGSDGEASASAGRFDTYTGAVSKNFIVSDALSINLSADKFQTGGYNTVVPDYLQRYWPGRSESSAYSENVRVTAFFKPSTDMNGFVRLGYHKQSEDIGGYLYGANVQKSPDMAASLTRYFDDKSSVQANFWAQWQKFDKYNGAGCYAAAAFSCGVPVAGAGATPAQQAARTIQYASSHDWNTYREKGGSAMYSKSFGGLLSGIQLGADMRKISGEDDQQSYATPTAAAPSAFILSRKNYGGGAQTFTGVFGQFKLAPVDALDISFSARWDTYESTNGVATQANYNAAGTTVTSISGGAVPNVKKSAFDPTLSARYDVDARLSLRGSTYKAFRAPGLNNLYRSFGSSSISVANPLLGPETLKAAEVGADWRGDTYSLGATLYAARVQDVVTTYTITTGSVIPQAVLAICGAGFTGVANAACPGTVSHYTNGQDQRSRGLELEGRWQPSRVVGLSSYFTRNLTFYQGVTTTDPLYMQLPLTPKNVFGLRLALTPGDQWTHTLEMRANTKQQLSSLGSSTVDPVMQGGFTVFNASTAYRVNKTFEWYASVVNLSDKRYSESSASSVQQTVIAMPRTLTTGVRAKF